MKIYLTSILLLWCSFSYAFTKWHSTVVIVTDSLTYQNSGAEIDRYLLSINQEGKKTILIKDIYQHPDSIRNKLIELNKSEILEGVVLIGDIPVPMIRDAQHLTTAFKMRQTRDWKESSVPSDRFYDDFELVFDYIKQDEENSLYHYYSLSHNSKQYISSNIYSARIKPPLVPGKNKYQLISEYLKKVVDTKQNKSQINRVLHFAGHGYNSESISARVDEAWALKYHFPFLGTRLGSQLNFINYTKDTFVKSRLMAELSNPQLDIAILHHHGGTNAQYLSDIPRVSSAQKYIEYAKRFFRYKIRNSKDTLKTKNYYLTEYNIPLSWVEGAFDEHITKEDSVFSASMDIYISDVYNQVSNAKFIMFDACYNGSFHRDDYISAHYIFNNGKTIITKANSVNSLQDIWSNELIGILDEGVCIGNWAKHIFTLESHLIGDPTFSFSSKQLQLDKDIVKEKNNTKYWRRYLKTKNSSDVKALAMVMLYKNKSISDDELLELLGTESNPIIRLQTFTLLKKAHSSQLSKAIVLGMADSYELLKRLATLTAGKSGDPALLPSISKLYFDPTTSVRQMFQLKYAIEQYPYDVIKGRFDSCRKNHPYWPTQSSYSMFIDNLEKTLQSKKADAEKLNDKETETKSKSFTISTQRNLCQTQHLNHIFKYLEKGDDNSLRLLIAETLGWYVYSYKKNEILEFCKNQFDLEQDNTVKNELQKTIKRLSNL